MTHPTLKKKASVNSSANTGTMPIIGVNVILMIIISINIMKTIMTAIKAH